MKSTEATIGQERTPAQEQILADLNAGKKDRAWRLFIQEYQSRLYNLCFRMLGNYDDAIDALQEAYVQIDRSLPGFRNQSSLYTWAYQVTVYVILNFRKKRSNHRNRHTGQEFPEISRPEDDPDRMCEEKYRKHLIHGALQKLPEGQRYPLIMHDLDGLTFAEIASTVDSTPGAVKVKVFRARKALERILLDGPEVPGFEKIGRFDGQLLRNLLS
ncbi:MAG: RNA polymerase sigma factor [Leptospiraceae bacterium]